MKIKIFVLFLFKSAIFSFLLGLYFLINDKVIILEYSLINFQSFNLEISILLDWMSFMFMSFVFFISCLIILYSGEYMEEDKNLNRFIFLVVLFVLSMMLLIISPNLISMLLGWDGLGLVSYCLVIYYQNIKSYNAGMLTALSNRIGDVALLMSISWMLNYGSWNYIYYLDFIKIDYSVNFISLFIILAAITKSAQIPFSSWLPAAMAAPTPVSSLVHSSTLVTAGVYLLIRFNFLLEGYMIYVLLLLSMLTMFMSGLGANYEFDLKKVIALSTLSQLGLMMSIFCLGEFKLAFFHLLTHALFKALLFMCAGNIIHSMGNCQDIRYMGGLIYSMPLTCSLFSISNFSLCGLPFLSGFYSKDLIVEVMSMNYLNIFVYLVFYLSVGLTVAYTFRLNYYLISGEFNYSSLNYIKEEHEVMLIGMMGLILLVIMGGSLLSWLIFETPYFICLSKLMKLMTLLMILLGGFMGYEVAKFKIYYLNKSLNFYNFSNFNSFMWNMPIISTVGVILYPIQMGELMKKVYDQGWFEYYGSKGTTFLFIFMSKLIQIVSNNHLKIYLSLSVIWIIFLLLNFY
uniref:NADH-ubiquinone oxidoreductase chain 5 n=1 Tax=Erotylinae sp. 2 ACP-2013 TaxID=1434613 RepID=A0A3G5FP11_9CUCU|nr:NADH dehydrogenase subunit 5 [Erotylinae sp. 2 ACP-2013]